MAVIYTFAKMADMHLCYFCAHGNACEAFHLYKKKFPGCLIPDAGMFTIIHQNLRARDAFVLPHMIEGDPEQCLLQIWKIET
jgi:hypothetical protein